MGKVKITQNLGDGQYKARPVFKDNTIGSELFAWCVDYTTDLSVNAEVASIEIAGNAVVGSSVNLLIAPGGAAHSASYGILVNPEKMTPAAFFYNAAILPGWQKWMPNFRAGKVTNKTSNTLSVLIYPGLDTILNRRVEPSQPLYVTVPVIYMGETTTNLFLIDDEVVVKFEGMSWGNGICIGFLHNPRENAIQTPCSEFSFTNNGATISNYTGPVGVDVAIPESCNDVIITGISDSWSTLWGWVYPLGQKQLKSLEIGSKITFIGDRSCFRNRFLEIFIPKQVTSIRTMAFSNHYDSGTVAPTDYDGIEELTFEQSESTLSLGSGCFSSNNMKNFTLPRRVASLGTNAFMRCGIENLTFEEDEFFSHNLTIQDYAFSNNRIETLHIPGFVTTIKRNGFRDNIISYLTLAQGVGTLESYAFFNNKISHVELPSSITHVGVSTFEMYYYKISSIYIWSSSVFFQNGNPFGVDTHNFATLYDEHGQGLYVRSGSIWSYMGV